MILFKKIIALRFANDLKPFLAVIQSAEICSVQKSMQSTHHHKLEYENGRSWCIRFFENNNRSWAGAQGGQRNPAWKLILT